MARWTSWVWTARATRIGGNEAAADHVANARLVTLSSTLLRGVVHYASAASNRRQFLKPEAPRRSRETVRVMATGPACFALLYKRSIAIDPKIKRVESARRAFSA
jgi:hypothetical protein